MKTFARALALGVAAGALFGAAALAQDFHGFDPASYDGKRLSAEQYAAMVADATAATPPRNGEKYVIGFANLQRDIAFGVAVERSIQENADLAGVDLVIADNRLDGPTALANAQSFVQRNVDYVIEFQTDSNFGPTVMNVFNEDGVKVVAIDIPMPGATFFGANNPKSGFMGGSYLAQAAIAKFGEERVMEGYFVVGELPQSGAIPQMRTEGQVNGFLSVLPEFDPEKMLRIDTKNTQQESFTQMSNLLGRIPEGVPIMITAINDQSAIGMLRAVQQAGREADVVVVGNGADETQALVDEADLVAATGYFPETYGNYLLPIALATLAGQELPPAVLVNHVMITKANVCEYYPDFECGEDPGFEYQFPQEEFSAYLTELRQEDFLEGFEDLVPAE
ncbi:ABC transporter [Devosia geojensis]|uniref:ABC transporter n=1 Tax=Devosia geojensis TaxID=443610 RepID=A0A0F5FQG2_9HYPH|nr:sugar ABC transporter substrate-binding protein [Devosia geojensis]KKB11048.1 ABC transporter [Devosia geojensis]